MKNNILESEIRVESASPTRLVSRELLHARTRELALLAGRVMPHITHADYAQAKLELTGESNPDRQDAMIEGRPEYKVASRNRALSKGDNLYRPSVKEQAA